MSESLLAYHCGPALAGIKPSNLVSCPKTDELAGEIEVLNMRLNRKDIYLKIICECRRRVLVMVYRKKKLDAHLRNSDNAAFLEKFGYTAGGGIENCIERLRMRMKFDSFPHEIGVFLGYPIDDIDSFIKNKGAGCIFSGDWKVYNNPEQARQTFKRYKACRNAIMRRISGGMTLAELFCA